MNCRIQIQWLFYGSLLILSACASAPATQPLAMPTGSPPNSASSATIDKLLSAYQRYQGTPYRYGGQDPNGFDCSGFINTVYREVFAVQLPRTTTAILKGGKKISLDDVRPGDILFFQTSKKQLHAGIYTGDGQFIHASTSKGVIQSTLKNSYWQQHYSTSRRYVQ